MSYAQFLYNFVLTYADPKIRRDNAWMPYQQAAGEKLLECLARQFGKILTWLWSRQSGKTECVSIIVVCAALLIFLSIHSAVPIIKGLLCGSEMAEAFPEGLRVGIFAPKGESGARDFQRIQRIVKRVTPRFAWRIDVSNTEMMTVYGQGIDGEERQVLHMELHSAAPASNLESGTFDLLLIEECQDIEQYKILQEIDPMRAATMGTRLEIGTVGNVKCQFDSDIDYNKAYDPDSHVEIPYTIPIACDYQRGKYQVYVQQQIARYGFDSDFFQQKFCLKRNYARGMLVSEEQFVMLHTTLEERWEHEPDELPEGVCVIGSLDIARSGDDSILYVGTADWRRVSNDPEDPGRPVKTVRWGKAYGDKYGHENYDQQFSAMRKDLEAFPSLKSNGALALDATGDRGDMTEKFEGDNFTVISVIFTGGSRDTIVDDRSGEVVHRGGRSSLCQEFIDEIATHRFQFAADEKYMGSQDCFRAKKQLLPAGHRLLEPDPLYKDCKQQFTNCIKKQLPKGLIDLLADPNDKAAHDDHPDAGILFTHCAHYFRPIDFSLIESFGERRATAGLLSDTQRMGLESLHRIVKL